MIRDEKAKYNLEITEGSEMALTEIRVTRIDGDLIEDNEVKPLITEFKNLFPADSRALQTS